MQALDSRWCCRISYSGGPGISQSFRIIRACCGNFQLSIQDLLHLIDPCVNLYRSHDFQRTNDSLKGDHWSYYGYNTTPKSAVISRSAQDEAASINSHVQCWQRRARRISKHDVREVRPLPDILRDPQSVQKIVRTASNPRNGHAHTNSPMLVRISKPSSEPSQKDG